MAKNIIIAKSANDNEAVELINNYIYNTLKTKNSNTKQIDISNNTNGNLLNNEYQPSSNNLIIINNKNDNIDELSIIYALRNTDKLAKSISENLEKNNIIVDKYYQQRATLDTSKDYNPIIRDTTPSETIIINYDKGLNTTNYLDYAEAITTSLLNYINLNTNNYTVVKGDSLYSIASKFSTTVNDIKTINNLTTNLLSIGQILKIPKKESATTTPPTNENLYTVVKGDSLYSIASKFSTTVNDIKIINNLTTNLLSIGQILKIPNTSNNKVYTVVKGDNLYSIARKFSTTVNVLKRINNLSSDILSIGQKLKIE